MSVEVLISPRISFSHDLNPIDDVIDDDDDRSNIPIEIYPSYPSCSVSDSAFEFVFTTHNGTLIRQSSTADQLFSDGKLLPIPIEEILSTTKEHITIIQSSNQEISQVKQPPLSHSCLKTENGNLCNVNKADLELKQQKKIRSLKELLQESLDDDDDEIPDENPPSPPLKPPAVATTSPSRNFWNFRRSSSLNNFDGRYKLGISSKLKLQLLSRSKSTGGNNNTLTTTTESATTNSTISNNDTSPTTIMEELDNKSDAYNFRRSKSVGGASGGGSNNNNNNKRNNNKESSFNFIKSLRKTVLLTTTNSTTKLQPEDKRDVAVINPITKQTNDTRFTRSASLNNYYPTGYGYSNQHQRFGRCKSVGQTTTTQTELHKQNSTKRRQSCSSSTSSDVDGRFSGWRKGQAGRRSGKGGYYGNCSSNSSSVRVNPVALNLPSPYISRVSLDVFGFGSLFCNGKIKNKKHINNSTTQPAPV